MEKKLFVGNLPHQVRDNELSMIFSECGTVVSAQVIIDKFTDRSKGFGFVTMSSAEEAQKAVETLDQKEVHNRPLRVSIAKPREDKKDRPPRRYEGQSRNRQDGDRNSGSGNRFNKRY